MLRGVSVGKTSIPVFVVVSVCTAATLQLLPAQQSLPPSSDTRSALPLCRRRTLRPAKQGWPDSGLAKARTSVRCRGQHERDIGTTYNVEPKPAGVSRCKAPQFRACTTAAATAPYQRHDAVAMRTISAHLLKMHLLVPRITPGCAHEGAGLRCIPRCTPAGRKGSSACAEPASNCTCDGTAA
jgi:hypothetical protein